jgi:hypothetical protein
MWARFEEVPYNYSIKTRTFSKWGLLVIRKWLYDHPSFVGVVWSAIGWLVRRTCPSFGTAILSRQVPGFNTHDSTTERQYHVSLVYRLCISGRGLPFLCETWSFSISLLWCWLSVIVRSNDNTSTGRWVIEMDWGAAALSDFLTTHCSGDIYLALASYEVQVWERGLPWRELSVWNQFDVIRSLFKWRLLESYRCVHRCLHLQCCAFGGYMVRAAASA